MSIRLEIGVYVQSQEKTSRLRSQWSTMSNRYISHSRQPPSPGDWESTRGKITRALLSNVKGIEKHRRTLVGGGVYLGLSGTVTRKDGY